MQQCYCNRLTLCAERSLQKYNWTPRKYNRVNNRDTDEGANNHSYQMPRRILLQPWETSLVGSMKRLVVGHRKANMSRASKIPSIRFTPSSTEDRYLPNLLIIGHHKSNSLKLTGRLNRTVFLRRNPRNHYSKTSRKINRRKLCTQLTLRIKTWCILNDLPKRHHLRWTRSTSL